MSRITAAVWCAVGLLLSAAIVTLQGCSNDAEPPTLSLRGEQNVTAAHNTSAAGTTTGITASWTNITASTEENDTAVAARNATATHKTEAELNDESPKQAAAWPTSGYEWERGKCWHTSSDKIEVDNIGKGKDKRSVMDWMAFELCRDACAEQCLCKSFALKTTDMQSSVLMPWEHNKWVYLQCELYDNMWAIPHVEDDCYSRQDPTDDCAEMNDFDYLCYKMILSEDPDEECSHR